MTTCPFNLQHVDISWKPIITQALSLIDQAYLNQLAATDHWLPGNNHLFNAFSQPLSQVNYVLFGESPYPRKISANGYAFWDASITDLWSKTGLNKNVNRATSMRHFIKMLLVTEGLLQTDNTSQSAISAIDKSSLIQTSNELFTRLLDHGFLLLNATPVLTSLPPKNEAKIWLPFIKAILEHLSSKKPDVTFLLFGKIAQEIIKIAAPLNIRLLIAEHPYNLSFINNLTVQQFFYPFHLLKKVN